MQRRAAAIYCVFFLVIGAGALGYIQIVDAQEPQVSLNAETRSVNDTITVDGRTYTVTEITEEEESGGGHGGGGGTVITGTLEWTNESARETATLAAGDTATYEDKEWTVVIENGSDVSSFTLEESFNVSRMLAEDDAVQNETVDYQGEPHVVYRENNSLVPLSEYLPEPETASFSEGDTFPYEGNDATVSNVNSEEVTLSWNSPTTNEIELDNGGNVTLNGQTTLVHFPNANEVQITQEFDRYQRAQDRKDYFHERKDGLWGVSLVSLMTAVILLGSAYMPVKD
jgi:hypothetical protein